MALIALGVAGIGWGVVHMDVAALGSGPPEHLDFAHRRPYDQVKRSAHAALPGTLLRAGAGFLLILGGRRVLRGPQE